MNVTVVGSYEEKLSKRNNESDEKRSAVLAQFEQVCFEIGKLLAMRGHRLIIAHGENPLSAEAIALKGFKTYEPTKYYPIIQHESAAELKAHLDAVGMSDVVILIGGGNGTYASGLSSLRRRKVMIPIPLFGGSAKDLCEIPEIDKTVVDEIRNLDLESADWVQSLMNSIDAILNAYPCVLIIHGRGNDGEELKKWIQDESSKSGKLKGIAEPVIMNLLGSGAVSVPHVFEDLASKVSAAIVIVTADDIGGYARIKGKETVPATALKLEVRARENVWVEVGWFWGRLGRERIFLWLEDTVEIPSDLQGVARTDADCLEAAWPSISTFLIGMRNNVTSAGDVLSKY